jgi:hypothetical protein
MTAVFSTWQPLYDEHGIATYPLGADKRPAIRGYMRIGLADSRQLARARRFLDADGLGFVAGARSGVTVLDIDSRDGRLLQAAMDEHGNTPLIARTPSGGYHLWFRHSGEERQIRPWGPRLPIDILGTGNVVAPPSRTAKGHYEFVEGDLDDLERLPVLDGIPAKANTLPAAALVAPRDEGEIGTRNKTLFKDCMRQARHGSTLEDLIAYAVTRNREFASPLGDSEVRKTAIHVWNDYETKGLNFMAGGHGTMFNNETEIRGLMMESPNAFILLGVLRCHHWRHREFVVANDMAATMPGGGWSRTRFVAARKRLEAGWIEVIMPASQHRPAIYIWTNRRAPIIAAPSR